ncbi:hypothetical protein V8F20_009986 [Naviculisporaceae sp. PSN 640]
MSGMEPLAAFGLVCNVMQAIHFTTQTAALCKKAFSTGSPDPELGILIEDSAHIYQDLVNSIQATTPLTEDETKLLRIAVKTQQAALEVRAEASRIISEPTKGNVVASIVGGIKAKLRENNLDKVQNKLVAYQRLLESGSLSLVCKKTDALSLQQEARFNDLDETLRNFIQSYSQGETRVERLIARHVDSVKETVRLENLRSQHTITTAVLSELSRTRQDINATLRRMDAAPPQWQLRETFLKSLKYDSMNDRCDQIAPTHEGTYQWIVRGTRPWVADGDVTISKSENRPSIASNCSHETATLNLPWQCFPCWIDSKGSHNKLYWIQGKPGSGKSTLMKFLVSEKSLWSDLRAFKSEPLVISHFFWAAGHPVQRSLRGLLLNMLSQLLLANEGFLDDIISHFPRAKFKHSHGDWSLGELQELVEKWFAKSQRSIFVFLDGLDEADSDEMAPQSLVSFVTERLATMKPVKLCVASRPEPAFRKFLAHAPTLHLHHITQFDMTRYILDSLLQAEPRLEGTPELERIVESVLDMACGVFLWVALTVRSLRRGLMNGDTPHEIHLRLIQMPRGLHSLYQDMWSRLNEDEGIYREEAAIYINLVLGWYTEQIPGPISLFHFLMASKPSMMDAILNDSVSSSYKELDSLLQETAKRIETRTAGLLEVAWAKRETDDHNVGLIHRSALEFFQNTTEGRQILQYETTTPRQRRMRMYYSVIAGIQARVTGQYTRGSFWEVQFPIALKKIHEAWEKCHITEDDALKLMSFCKRVYDSNMGIVSRMIPWSAPPIADFAGIAAFTGLPHLISVMVNRAQLGGSSKSESPATAVDPGPEGKDKKLHLIVLLSILQNQKVWPTSVLSLPEAIKYFTRKCLPCLETKVLVIFKRSRLGDRGENDEYDLHISIFGDRTLKTNAGSEMRFWVALEMNIVALVELLLQALIANGHDRANTEASRQALDALRRRSFRSYQPHTRIAVFNVPGQLQHHVGLADTKQLRLRQVPSEKDHGRIKSCLDKIRRDDALTVEYSGERYQIPKLTQCLRALGERSPETTDLGAFMKVMATNPLNKMAEEFMANPPNRYEP